MFFSGLRKGAALAEPAPLMPASRKKILTVRGERSERPVALPTAPAKLIKPGYAGPRRRGPACTALGTNVAAATDPHDDLVRSGRGTAVAPLATGHAQGWAGRAAEADAAEVGLGAFGVPGPVP